MKSVPFVANSSDDLHCVPAVFRMLNQYFFGKDLSWEEIDEILHVTPGKGTWNFPGLTYFSKKGLKITHIENVDYQKVFEKGAKYVKEIFGEKTADYYIQKSNLPNVTQYIPEYLKSVNQFIREATVEEVLDFVRKGNLVGIELNSAILNNFEEFNIHYVLFYDFDGENIYMHDPGLPPKPGRKVTVEEFTKAFAYPGANKSLTSFSK